MTLAHLYALTVLLALVALLAWPRKPAPAGSDETVAWLAVSPLAAAWGVLALVLLLSPVLAPLAWLVLR